MPATFKGYPGTPDRPDTFAVSLSVEGDALRLALGQGYLTANRLTGADRVGERAYLAAAGFDLEVA